MGVKIQLERPIAYYPVLAKALGGIKEAIFVQQLLYWSNKGGRKDGFIYKTAEEIEEETTIQVKSQYRLRKKLEEMGVIEVRLLKANGAPTLHYKVTESILSKRLNGIGQNDRIHSDKMTDSITETTTETTTEINTMSEIQDFFSIFWMEYPKKEKKKESLSIWKKMDLDSKAQKIIEFVREAKETDRWKKGFVKQPTTFLRGECWEDDLASYGDARGSGANKYKVQVV